MKANVRLRRGQAAVEYILVFAALIVVAVMTLHLVRATKKASYRTVNLVSSDYP